MARQHRILVIAGTLVALCACEPAERGGVEPVVGFGAASGDAAADGAADAGVERDEEPLAFGVVASDYTATSVSLLGPDARMLARGFIDSGSASAGLVTALAGDVVLPTRSGDPRTLTLLDRFRTDVVTRVDPANGRVVGQVKTHRPNAEGVALSSNPQDYVQLGEHEAWVSRFEPNLGVAEDDPDRGIDLLRIDPTSFERGDRISLWHLNSTAPRVGAAEGSEAVTVYARPSAMVRVGERLVVGIASLSQSFDAAGEGMVALVDPDARNARRVALPGLQNCGSVVPVPDDATRVVVACLGFYRATPRDGAGLVLLRLEDDALVVEHVWRGADVPEAPLAVANVVAIGGSEVVAVAEGVSDPGVGEVAYDAAYVVDVASGQQTLLFEASDSYVIGSGAFNPRRRLLLVPDASHDGEGRPTAGVRTFVRGDDGAFEAAEVIEIHDVLPARQVRPL